MDKKLKADWIKALRGGRYKQGYGRLRVTPGGSTKPAYCCLGVLCKVVGAKIFDDGRAAEYQGERNIGAGYLPQTINVPVRVQRTLVDMNDGRHESFAAIADYIEAKL